MLCDEGERRERAAIVGDVREVARESRALRPWHKEGQLEDSMAPGGWRGAAKERGDSLIHAHKHR